jgi:hypothetical protein
MTAYYNKGAYSTAHYSAGSVFDCSGALAINLDIAGSFANPVLASGHMAIAMTFGAHLSQVFALKGALPIVIPFNGTALNGVLSMSGQMAVMVSINDAEASAAPLWGQDPLCPSPWTPSDPCPPVWQASTPPGSTWTPSGACDG